MTTDIEILECLDRTELLAAARRAENWIVTALRVSDRAGRELPPGAQLVLRELQAAIAKAAQS